MKAKHLIKILKAVDPESEVDAQIGGDNDQTYRDLCAMAELISTRDMLSGGSASK